MPRGERRRWWLERSRARSVSLVQADGGISRARYCASIPPRRSPTWDWCWALWRLVRVKRIEAAHLRRVVATTDDARAAMLRDYWAMATELLDADAAVIDSRVREEEMRVERDALLEELGHYDPQDYEPGDPAPHERSPGDGTNDNAEMDGDACAGCPDVTSCTQNPITCGEGAYEPDEVDDVTPGPREPGDDIPFWGGTP